MESTILDYFYQSLKTQKPLVFKGYDIFPRLPIPDDDPSCHLDYYNNEYILSGVIYNLYSKRFQLAFDCGGHCSDHGTFPELLFADLQDIPFLNSVNR